MNIPGSVSSVLQCGACQNVNESEAQFCAGCGHALFEPCFECATPVTLTQKFCVSCGKDLAANLQRRRQAQEERLANAVQATRSHHYEHALAILEPLAKQRDYRFAEITAGASQAREKVQQIHQRTSAGADDALKLALQAYEKHDRREAKRLLEMVPVALMDTHAKKVLGQCQMHLERVTSLHRELQLLLKEKQYRRAGENLAELLELEPEHEKYRSLAKQVGVKLVKIANKKFARQDYGGALNSLNGVPTMAHDDAYYETRRRIETAEWLSDEIPREPFATAALGRLAVRFSKEVPGDLTANALVQDLTKAVKERPSNPRMASPSWRGSSKTWLGGTVGVLGVPKSLAFDDDVRLALPVGQFSVAFGLALQGLGIARVEHRFGAKKGLLASLSAPKRKQCWGIDIGSSGIKAVLIRRDKTDEKPIVISSYHAAYAAPTCRPGNERQSSEIIQATLKEMLATIDTEECLVWVNIPAREIVSRFLHLPPVNLKQAEKLLDHEGRQRIPIPYEDLEVVHWMGSLQDEISRGRPAFVGAVTKLSLKRRQELLDIGNLKVDGMQADPLALINFASYEFVDLLGESVEESESPTDVSDDQEGEEENAGDKRFVAYQEPAVALIDAGAEKTTLLLMSRNAFWYWTHESGGEDLTTLLTRTTKKVNADAEELKRNPAALEQPALMYEPVEGRQAQLRERLKKLAEEGRREFDYFDIVESWCVGKASLAHAWIRRILQTTDSQRNG